MKRTDSGISVPLPRTWRSMEPRSTVPIQTVARSTAVAAGLSRDSPRVTAAATTAVARGGRWSRTMHP